MAATDRASIASIPVKSTQGDVPLGSVATIDTSGAPAVVYHDGGERRISVGIDVRDAFLSRAVGAFERTLGRELHLPPGYRVEVTGEAAARRAAALRLVVLGVLGFVALRRSCEAVRATVESGFRSSCVRKPICSACFRRAAKSRAST